MSVMPLNSQSLTMEQLQMKPKRKVGRPSNQERQLTQTGLSLLQEMVDTYEAGGSDEEVCKVLRILPKEFAKKYRADNDFAQLVDYGRLASKAWWLSVGRKAVTDKNSYNFNFWSANMEHRFDWRKSSNVNVSEQKEEKSVTELLEEFMSKKIGAKRLISTAVRLGDADGRIDTALSG